MPKAKRRWAEMRPLKDVRGAFIVPRPGVTASEETRVRDGGRGTAHRPEPGSALTTGISGRFGRIRGQALQDAQRVARDAQQAAREHLEVAGLRRHGVLAPLRHFAPLGREVEQRAEDLGAGDAVDDRVVDLREQRDLAVGEAVDQIGLPERARPVQRPAEMRATCSASFLLVRRRAAPARAHGSRGRSPGRRPSRRSRGRTAPPRAASETAAAAAAARRSSPGCPRAEPAVLRRRRVEHGQAADVPVLAGRSEGEELRVETGELSHVPTVLPAAPGFTTENRRDIEKAPLRGPFRSRPVSRILSRAVIHLSGLPGPRRAACKRSCLALHQVGFAWPPCHHGAGALLPHLFNLAGGGPEPVAVGGVFSVALSRGFPRVGVTDHLALRCPDFPRRRHRLRDCSACGCAR